MENTQKLQTITNRKLLTAFIALLVLNAMTVTALTKKTGVYNLDGSYSDAGSTEILITALTGLLVSFPLLCAIIGAILALFIDRTQPYKKRFARAFLFTLVVIYAILLAVYAFNLFS